MSGQTTALFSADAVQPTATGPFPSNALTVADESQMTGLRVNLPASAETCDAKSRSVCSNTDALNQLDGFSVNPRLMVCFSAPVDLTTLKNGISLVSVAHGKPHQIATAINQIEFDSASNCALAKPDQVLDQDAQYLLLVTNSVLDAHEAPVTASSDFETCLEGSTEYCAQLSSALKHTHGLPSGLVAASWFTTMSATNWLEQARANTDEGGSFTFPAGLPSTFAVSSISSLTWTPSQSGLPNQSIPVSSLKGVSQISFGLFLSPNYLATSGPDAGTIANTPTGQDIAGPNSYLPISYHVFLPAATRGKIPVVIYGHGLGDNQFGAPTYIASTLAQRGFATLGFEITGHGYGPNSTVTVTGTNGGTATEWTPGRGINLGSGTIGSSDGCIVPGAIAVRDCGRQTAVDLFALVAAIRSSNGLGLNLDPNRIYYVGQSFGSTYGTLFSATEPASRAAVLNGDGGTSADTARLAITARPIGVEFLMSVNPQLLNVALGIAPADAYLPDQFNDGYVFRNIPTAANLVAGAIPIQAAFEAADWLGMNGDPLAFAQHLSASPLQGVGPKGTLFQFGLGDLEVPNPTESAVVRAANAQSSTSYFRFDKAAAIDSTLLGTTMVGVSPLPILPHRLLSNPSLADPVNAPEIALAQAWQLQVADFFASDGHQISDPNAYLPASFAGKGIFETPPAVLPDYLNFLQLAP